MTLVMLALSCLLGEVYSGSVSTSSIAPWIFENETKSLSSQIKTTYALSDQISRDHKCCSGRYLWTGDISNWSHGQKSLSLYVPAIGGSFLVKINGLPATPLLNQYSAVGIVIPISDFISKSVPLTIEINLQSQRGPFSGIWKRPPVIAPLQENIESLRQDLYQQRVVPLFFSIGLILVCIPFIWIYCLNRRAFRKYGLFSFSLLSWSIFFFFLSGMVRDWNLDIGSAMHFPIRTLAALGLFAQILSQTHASRDIWIQGRNVFIFQIIAQVVLGCFGASTSQMILWNASGVIGLIPLFYFDFGKEGKLTKVVFSLSVIALLGQLSDGIKLLDGLFGFEYKVPFLNRATFFPLLVTSFAQYTIEFSQFFVALKIHRSRLRRVARAVITMGARHLIDDKMDDLAKAMRRTMNVRRVTICRKSENSYVVIAVSGVPREALGSQIRLEQLKIVQSAVQTGEIGLGLLNGKSGEWWKSNAYAVVPVPLKKNPEYLILVSDPLNRVEFESSEIPYLSQFSTALWANLLRSKEMSEKQKVETQMNSLLKALDPNLYLFILENIELNSHKSIQVSEDRGIIFFDQKGYSTFLEELDETRASVFTTHLSSWLVPLAAKYGAKITSFEGDSYLVELINIHGENTKSVGLRTVNLVWALLTSVPNLNQTLLVNGFAPVSFRFGAHYGSAASIQLDFIHKGLRNTVGDNVIITKRIQSLAPPGHLFVSAALAKLVEDEFEFRVVSNQYVKGRKQTIGIVEVIGRVEGMAA